MTATLLWFAKVSRKLKLSEPHPHNTEFGQTHGVNLTTTTNIMLTKIKSAFYAEKDT